MKGYVKIIIAVIAIILLWYFYDSFINLFKADTIIKRVEVIKTDTVFVPVISPPKIEYVNVPFKVYVQKEPDTLQRKKVEKQTIVTGSELKNNTYEVTKIDTSGNLTKDLHTVPENSYLVMDNEGNVEVKADKKKIRKAKIKKFLNNAAIVSGAIIGILIGSVL